jgi:hypothetical protein
VSDFKGRHFEGEIVLWAVRWYCRYGISYRDLELTPYVKRPYRDSAAATPIPRVIRIAINDTAAAVMAINAGLMSS